MKRMTRPLVAGVVVVAVLAALLSAVVVANPAFAQGGLPNGRGGGGDRGGSTVVINAAATALGLTADELRTQLRTNTLAAIAQTRGVSGDTVEAAIVAAKKAEIDQLSTSLDLNALFAALGGPGGGRGPGSPGGTPHPLRTPGPTRTPTP